jgi:hypothetical protein
VPYAKVKSYRDQEGCLFILVCFVLRLQIARGGQSVTLVGSTLVMFGGEDSKRRLMNDLNILDLETLTWKAVDTRYIQSHGHCIVIVFACSHVLTYQLHIILAV